MLESIQVFAWCQGRQRTQGQERRPGGRGSVLTLCCGHGRTPVHAVHPGCIDVMVCEFYINKGPKKSPSVFRKSPHSFCKRKCQEIRTWEGEAESMSNHLWVDAFVIWSWGHVRCRTQLPGPCTFWVISARLICVPSLRFLTLPSCLCSPTSWSRAEV